MPDISDLTNRGNDIVAKAVGAADAVVGAARDAVRDNAHRFEKVADLMPDPSDVVDQVTATANELLGLASRRRSSPRSPPTPDDGLRAPAGCGLGEPGGTVRLPDGE
jgi:hypothetical protein